MKCRLAFATMIYEQFLLFLSGSNCKNTPSKGFTVSQIFVASENFKI